MEPRKIYGILSVILGILFIIFPITGTVAISTIIGLSFIFFGIGIALLDFSAVNIIVGILSVILGFIFLFNFAAFSFLLGFQFYVIAIILVLAGIAGIFSSSQISKMPSIVILILGILAFAVGGLSIDQPLFATIFIGLSLILEGISLFLE